MTIYIDSDYKCHMTDAPGRMAVETDIFDGKCRTYIEGFRYIPVSGQWTRPDGVMFKGEMVAPFINFAVLTSAQAEYEAAQASIAELDVALLDAAYENLIGGIEL